MAEPIARACVLPDLPYPTITAVDVSVLRIRADAGINRRWVMHALNSALVRGQAEREASGTTRKRITRKKLGRVMVPMPPIGEQDQIVGTLSEIGRQLDHAEEALTRASNGMRALSRAFYRDLGFGLQDLPEGWQRKQLSEIAECKLGKMLDAQKNEGTARPYLRNMSVQWGHFDLGDVKEMRIKDSEAERFEVRRGDLMMCEGGEPGRCAIWDRDEVMFFQKALHRIRPTEAVSATYLQRYFAFAAQAGALERHLTGTTIKHLPGNKLAAIDIPVPPLAEQREIVRRASDLDEQLAPVAEGVAVAGRQRGHLLRAALNAAALGRLRAGIPPNSASENSAAVA
ncbi:MAG: restriction endonuclease subunit S [Thermoleophilaceae bacterium]|nr:restriction endonuclease subunit S [Thermoleophilaceae bacterium]